MQDQMAGIMLKPVVNPEYPVIVFEKYKQSDQIHLWLFNVCFTRRKYPLNERRCRIEHPFYSVTARSFLAGAFRYSSGFRKLERAIPCQYTLAGGMHIESVDKD